jgi:hypothetical protein
MSQIAEAYCFTAVGISLHRFQDPKQVSLPLIGIALFTLLAGRALTIFGICSLGNSMYPSKFDMPRNEQAVLYAGGLIRGAICWAQAIQVRDPHRHVMLSTTLAIILFTTLFIGTLLPKFLHLMKLDDKWHAESPLRKNHSTSHVANDPQDTREADTLLTSSHNSSVGNSNNINNSMVKNFDNIIMKPIFGGKIKLPYDDNNDNNNDNNTFLPFSTLSPISSPSESFEELLEEASEREMSREVRIDVK